MSEGRSWILEEYSFLCPSQKRADEMRASWGTKASGSGHGWEGHLSARARKELDVPVCRDGMSKQPKFRFKLHEAKQRPRLHRQSELYSPGDSGASGRSKDSEEPRELTSVQFRGTHSQ